MPQFLDSSEPGFEDRFAALLSAKREDSPDVDEVVGAIKRSTVKGKKAKARRYVD